MPVMTFNDFAALTASGFRPGLVEPVAENLRRLIVERMAAALELVQYGTDGAGVGEEVLPTFAAAHNSELGMWFPVSPVLMVYPAGGPSDAEDHFFKQAHEITVRVDLMRDAGANISPEIVRGLVTDLHYYVRALTWIILNLTALELITGMTDASAPSWNITAINYDSLRRREGTTIFRWAAQITVEVTLEER